MLVLHVRIFNKYATVELSRCTVRTSHFWRATYRPGSSAKLKHGVIKAPEISANAESLGDGVWKLGQPQTCIQSILKCVVIFLRVS